MTPLRKRLARVIQVELKQGRPESLVVTLYPGGALGFRHPRSRTEYLLDLRSAYLLAASREADRRLTDRRGAKTPRYPKGSEAHATRIGDYKKRRVPSRIIRRA